MTRDANGTPTLRLLAGDEAGWSGILHDTPMLFRTCGEAEL
jgi:hypothetical protein